MPIYNCYSAYIALLLINIGVGSISFVATEIQYCSFSIRSRPHVVINIKSPGYITIIKLRQKRFFYIPAAELSCHPLYVFWQDYISTFYSFYSYRTIILFQYSQNVTSFGINLMLKQYIPGLVLYERFHSLAMELYISKLALLSFKI